MLIAKDIKVALTKHADADKAARDSVYLKNLFLCLGVRAEQRRNILKPFWDKNSQPINWQFINDCWNDEAREMQYTAIDYLWRKVHHLTKPDVSNIKKLVQEKSWWDTIDGLCCLFGDMTQKDESIKQTMLDWSEDENYWVRRVAIQHQLRLRGKTDAELLSTIIKNNFDEKEQNSPSSDGKNEEKNRAFFINKSIGWALREYAKTDPDWVCQFVESNKGNISKLSIREALKHMKPSGL